MCGVKNFSKDSLVQPVCVRVYHCPMADPNKILEKCRFVLGGTLIGAGKGLLIGGCGAVLFAALFIKMGGNSNDMLSGGFTAMGLSGAFICFSTCVVVGGAYGGFRRFMLLPIRTGAPGYVSVWQKWTTINRPFEP